MRLLAIISIVLFLTSCKTYSYFKTPNDLLKQDCIVYMLDGTQKKGKLTIQFETGHSTENVLHLSTSENRDEKIAVQDIKYYQLNGESYFPKKVDMDSYEIPVRNKIYLPDTRNLLFVKRLTSENAKISLFELYEASDKTADGFAQYDYFVSFPSQDRLVAWSTRGKLFFPNFEDKVSELVSDCQILSQKIKQKNENYYARQVSVDAKKNEVIKRIITEYNECK